MTLLEYDGWNDDIWGRAEFLLWFDDWVGLRLKDGASFLMQGKCNKQTKKQKTNKLETNKQTNKEKAKHDLMTGVRLKESQLPHAGHHDGPESDSIEMGWLW